ncbi:MAG: site-2 protease family protein [Actinomycetota bacterium]
MLRGWRIGRIGGIDIRIDPSWPIVAVLITVNLWALLAQRAAFTGTSPTVVGLLAVTTAVLFFLSVLAHELAHAFVARVRGIEVGGITLVFFGGATHARLESKGPFDEFLVTAGGPLTSLGVGGLFLLAHAAVAAGSDLDRIFEYLGRINIILGLFNLLPGLPLDGGRLLRSLVWRATGNIGTGTRIAARAGQVLGAVMAAVGLGLLVTTGSLGDAWFAFIGWFLFRAASESLVEGERTRLLAGTTARDVMSAPPPTIPADLSLREAVRAYLDGHGGEAFPVTEDDRVVGFVSLKIAEGKVLDAPVRDAMGDLGGIVEARPDDPLLGVTERLQEARGQAVLVLDDGRLVGVIEADDLSRLLRRSATMPRRRD